MPACGAHRQKDPFTPACGARWQKDPFTPACGARWQKDPFTPCLRCHRPSFPESVSCFLSCEDPCHTGLPRGNHLNGTSATTPFQMGSQLGFWDAGPQHGLPTISPVQAPPRGPQGWATELGKLEARGGGAVGRGAGVTSLRPGNQD